MNTGTYMALAGGVGGAKLADGLARILPPDELTIIVNTGDDFRHLGLHVSPDIDTVVYTLAGRANPQTGWGRSGETWSFMAALREFGGEDWFQLGDQDLAMHVERTRLLAGGSSLSAVTARLASRLGIGVRIVPMSNDAVRTIVVTDDEELEFQHYFVRLQCRPAVRSLRFDGAETALATRVDGVAWTEAAPRAVILCPSNPYLSIAPILAIPGVRGWFADRRWPVIAVSPIIGGQAVKGPAAKIMGELGEEASSLTVARFYAGLIDILLIDDVDAGLVPAIRELGIEPVVTDTLMRDAAGRERLAATILNLRRLRSAR